MLVRLIIRSALAACLGLSIASAQTPEAAHPFSITRSDPALDAIVAPDAKVKTVVIVCSGDVKPKVVKK